MDSNNKQIPPTRKSLYYWGMAVIGFGFLLFLSNFPISISNFGNFDNFGDQMMSSAFRGFGGMILLGIVNAMMNVAKKGWAGAGILLDPEQARKDIEPWSRMQGGVIQDALSEVDLVKKLEKRLEPSEPQIKVRCKNCQALNDEVANFCNKCGTTI